MTFVLNLFTPIGFCLYLFTSIDFIYICLHLLASHDRKAFLQTTDEISLLLRTRIHCSLLKLSQKIIFC